MKTLKHIYKVFFVFMLLIGCSDNSDIDEVQASQEDGFDKSLGIEDQIMSIPNNSFTDKAQITAYADVMKEVLSMSDDSDFRSYVYENAQELSASGDDYIVYLDETAKTFKGAQRFGKSMSKIESLTAEIKEFDNDARPMVFFPKAETIEDNAKASKGYEVAKNLNQPIGVFKGAYNDDYSVPGYRLNTEGKLVFERMVTEEYAWENDVYVIGDAEEITDTPTTQYVEPDFDSGGGGGGGGGTSSNDTRSDGRTEYGGLIQVIALNEIEHWTSGKLELRLIVSGLRNSGGTVIRDLKFPKVKRKNFKDEKWYDYSEFLFNWNLTTLADYNIEKWMERDNGLMESTLEIDIPGTAYKPATEKTPAQPALPGAKVSIKYRRGDEELGTAFIQFTDKISQVYGLGQAKIKRK